MRKKQSNLYYRILKRKNKNYVSIEQKENGTTKHLITLPGADIMFNILNKQGYVLLEKKNGERAEKSTRE